MYPDIEPPVFKRERETRGRSVEDKQSCNRKSGLTCNDEVSTALLFEDLSSCLGTVEHGVVA